MLFTLVALLVAVAAFLLLSGNAINTLIKQNIEQVGTKVTQQSVTVKSVDMKLLEGAGTINGLVLANPESYKAPAAFSLNEVTLDINLESLATELIIIDRIIIDKPQAFVEFTQSGGANMQDILDAIKQNTASNTVKKSSEETSADESSDPTIRVNQFILAGVALNVDLTALGNKNHQVTLTNINLENIGGSSGMPASQLGAELVKQALSSIYQQAKEAQINALKGQAKEKLKEKAKDKVGGLLNTLGG